MAYRKLVILILIPAIFISSAYSAFATDWFYAVKEMGLDLAARAIASAIVRSMTGKLIQKIQSSGEGGRPAFVQNWTNFLTDNQYKGEDAFRAILASTPLCGYLNSNIKGLFEATSTQLEIPLEQNTRVNNLDFFELRASCTMLPGFNMASYQQNFSENGGWNTWNRLLEPQNNYYGLLFQSLDETARQRNLYERAAHGEVQAGSGYTSVRDACQGQFAETENIGPSQPSQARCTFMGKILTPADLLGKTAATTIDKDLEGIINSDELAETLIAIGNALVNRLANLAEAGITSRGGEDNGTPYSNEQAYTKQTLKEEYCSASKPSQEAIDFVKASRSLEFAYFDFPVFTGDFCNVVKFNPTNFKIKPEIKGLCSIGMSVVEGKSYCDLFREGSENNPYPYQRCILACFKSIEAIPKSASTPKRPDNPPAQSGESNGEGQTCDDVPTAIACLSTTQHHASLVTTIKNYLISENINITGSCGAFEITKRVAWALRNEGVGLLQKPAGNNCNGFSVDNVAYTDGSGADILGDAGGANTPQWAPGPPGNLNYAPPFDPGDPEGSY